MTRRASRFELDVKIIMLELPQANRICEMNAAPQIIQDTNNNYALNDPMRIAINLTFAKFN